MGMNEFARPSVQAPRMPVIPTVPPKDRRWTWVGVGFASGVILTLLVMWLFSLRRGPEMPAIAPTSTPTPTTSVRPTSTPTPTPSPTINPADWTFEVLNGSGVGGAAAKAAQILRDRGYIVRNVGNADEQNFEESQLLVTSERAEEGSALLADLKTEFPVNEVDATLESTSVTARLIIGKDWEVPATSPTTSPKASPKSSPTPKP